MSWFDDGGKSKLDAAQEKSEIDEYLEKLMEDHEVRHRREMEEYQREYDLELMMRHIEWEDSLLEFTPENMTDAQKLRAVAEWFEKVYPNWKEVVRMHQKAAGMQHRDGEAATPDDHSVENELRRMAHRLDTLDEIENPKPFRPGGAFEVRDTTRRRYG